MSAADCEIAKVVSAPWMALAAIEVAREHLFRYAIAIDCPIFGAVEAADMLDSARDALVGGLIR